MFKFLSVTVLTLLLVSSCISCTATLPIKENPAPTITAIMPDDESAALRLVLPSGDICSGTAIAPNVILTATHCFEGETGKAEMIVNGRMAVIKDIISDKNDHSLAVVDITLEHYATFGPTVQKRDNIHFWGNPAIPSSDGQLYRRGYMSGYRQTHMLFDINGYFGDSGAGVFNEDNELVAVISFIYVAHGFKMTGAFPINFTHEQLSEAGIQPDGLWTVKTLASGQTSELTVE